MISPQLNQVSKNRHPRNLRDALDLGDISGIEQLNNQVNGNEANDVEYFARHVQVRQVGSITALELTGTERAIEGV